MKVRRSIAPLWVGDSSELATSSVARFNGPQDANGPLASDACERDNHGTIHRGLMVFKMVACRYECAGACCKKPPKAPG